MQTTAKDEIVTLDVCMNCERRDYGKVDVCTRGRDEIVALDVV